MCGIEICQVRDAKDTFHDGMEDGCYEKTEAFVREAMAEAGLESDEDQIAASSIWLGDIGESDSELKVILKKIRDSGTEEC